MAKGSVGAKPSIRENYITTEHILVYMKKVYLYIILVCFLAIFCAPGTALGLPVHNINTGEDFATIQGAISDPDTSNGHTITIDDGTYYETVTVNKALTIRSVNQSHDKVKVHAPLSTQTVFGITTNGCTISHLTVEGGDTGVYIYNSDNVLIQHNNITNMTTYGVRIALASSNNTINENIITRCDYGVLDASTDPHNTVSENTMFNQSTSNVYVYQSDYTRILDNKIYDVPSGNSHGVDINQANHVVIDNNSINDTWHAIVSGNADNTTITNNELYGTQSGMTSTTQIGLYLLTVTDNIISENTITSTSYGMYSNVATNTVFEKNTISNSINNGLLIHNNTGLSMTNNTLRSCAESLEIYTSSNSTVYGNTIVGDSSAAVQLYTSSNVTFQRNAIYDSSTIGLYIRCSNNTFFDNYLANNNNVNDDSNNIWNITKTLGTNIVGGPYVGGNYWSNYPTGKDTTGDGMIDTYGEDTDGDGLGDTLLPYNNSGPGYGSLGQIQNGGDYHPLVSPPQLAQSVFTEEDNKIWAISFLLFVIVFMLFGTGRVS